jgi:hypothetical protein
MNGSRSIKLFFYKFYCPYVIKMPVGQQNIPDIQFVALYQVNDLLAFRAGIYNGSFIGVLAV